MDHHMSMLVFTIFGEKDRWKGILLMILLPYINSYIKYFYNKIVNMFSSKYCSVTLSVKHDKGKVLTYNPSYTAVCWYSEKFDVQQKRVLCEEHSAKSNEKVGMKIRSAPIYHPVNSIIIPYEKSKIEIRFNCSDTEKTVTLNSNCLSLLKKFIKEADDKYHTYFYSNFDENQIYVCQWKMPKYSNEDGTFEPMIMSVNKTFNNVYLTKEIKEGIRKDIETFLENKDFYIEKGIPYKRGFLLHGPPGTGKNSLIYAVAREYKMNLYKISLRCKTPEHIKQAILKIPPRSILFIDEIDMNIYNDRQANIGKDMENKFPMSVLMDILDGYDYLNDCLVFLTTNNIESLDPSLIRPGRIDLQFYLDKLNFKDIRETIKHFTSFEVEVPQQVSMTSSSLINQILLPHKNDKAKIQTLINNYIC